MTRYLAGADVGGTFTDVAVYDTETRTLSLNKLLTTPDDPRRAIVNGLAALNMPAGLVVHGTTLVTNALIERRGVPAGLLTTDGYRDVLEIGTELRYDTFDLQLERPAPLVARRFRRPIRERLGADGSVVLPLNEADVAEAAAMLHGAGIRSVAIAFFNSYRNPVHEDRAKAIVQAAFPDLAVCTSAEIAPEVREYERFFHLRRQRLYRPDRHTVSAGVGAVVGRATLRDAVRWRDHHGTRRQRAADRAGRVGSGSGRDGRSVPGPGRLVGPTSSPSIWAARRPN